MSDESVFKKIACDFMKDPGLKPMKTLSPFRGLKAPAPSGGAPGALRLLALADDVGDGVADLVIGQFRMAAFGHHHSLFAREAFDRLAGHDGYSLRNARGPCGFVTKFWSVRDACLVA